MTYVPVTFNGVFYPKGRSASDKPIAGVFVGNAWVTGLAVGGGPVYPKPEPPLPGVPAFPIWGPPGMDLPDKPGYPPVAGHPLPEPPPTPPDIPEDPSIVKPPPPEGGWGWSPTYGWGYFPGSGSAGPKK